MNSIPRMNLDLRAAERAVYFPFEVFLVSFEEVFLATRDVQRERGMEY